MATLRCGEDAAVALRRAGVTVRLGSVSAPALVAAADAEVLGDGNAALLRRAIYVRAVAGSLPGLRPTVVLTVLEGPFSGAYAVDRVLTGVEGNVQRFTAYPSVAPAVPLWVPGSILLPWALRTAASEPGSPLQLTGLSGGAVLVAETGEFSGLDTTLDLVLEVSDEEAGPFEDSGTAWLGIDASDEHLVAGLPEELVEKWIRLRPQVHGDPGASFTCGAALLDVAVPRA